MVVYIKQFFLLAIILFCIHMIYYHFRNLSKKYKNVPTIEMSYLIRIFSLDLSKIGIKIIEKHISIINSCIISIDLLIYYNISNSILRLFVVFIFTLISIFITYNILGLWYKKILYR